MSHLYEILSRGVDKWRADGYSTEGFPALAETFEWAAAPRRVRTGAPLRA